MIDHLSSVSNNFYNPQVTTKVANVDGTNLANSATNQSAFSSYIEAAFAQLRSTNPTINTAPVISAADKSTLREDDTQKSLKNFIQELFSILSQKDSGQVPTIANQEQQSILQNVFSQESESSESNSTDNESTEINTTAVAAYTADSSSTVANILANIQKLVDKLNLNVVSDNTGDSESSKIQSIQNSFQSILGAQGAAPETPTSLAIFLQTLAHNLEGQSPLGIIINTQA